MSNKTNVDTRDVIDVAFGFEDAAWEATESAVDYSTKDAIKFVITNAPYWEHDVDIGNALGRELNHVK
jgi:hypothetical protein